LGRNEAYSEGGAAVLNASAAVPISTARIQAAQKNTGIRSTTLTAVAAIRLNCFALIDSLDVNDVWRSPCTSPARRSTLTPLDTRVKGVRTASQDGHAIPLAPAT